MSEFLNDYELYHKSDGILNVLPRDFAEKVTLYLLRVGKIMLPIWSIYK